MAGQNGKGGDGGPDEQSLLVALRHPLRREILRIMGEAGEPISPRELSDKLRQPLSNTSYHVRVLAEHGTAQMVHQAPVRGSMQHFYEMTIEEEWALSALGFGDNGANGSSGEVENTDGEQSETEARE